MTDSSAHLRHELASFTSHTFLPFESKHSQDLSHARGEFLESFEAFQHDAQQQHAEKERLLAIQQRQKAEFATEEARAAEMAAKLRELELTASTILPNQLAIETKKINTAESVNLALAKDVQTLTSIHAREIDAVTRGVATFRERLGITFAVKDGKLQLSFIYISKSEPLKPFTIAIFVDENKEYQVHACTSELPAVQMLIDELNKSNNFAKFIGQVRKQFVMLENPTVAPTTAVIEASAAPITTTTVETTATESSAESLTPVHASI